MLSKRKSEKKRSSFLINVLLFAVFVFVLVELISMQLEIAQKKSELNEINGSLETILVSNDQLKRYYAEENRKEYIEQIARDQLDYSYADETVYYFVQKLPIHIKKIML